MRVIYYWSLLALLVVAMASGEEANGAKEEATKPAAPDAKPAFKGTEFDAKDHTDWGTYYDPKNEFCGRFDCYKILGFDYESFGKEHPDKKVITQRYRSLSREWHPDKSKHKNAKNRFVVSVLKSLPSLSLCCSSYIRGARNATPMTTPTVSFMSHLDSFLLHL